ncbi:histidine kinase [Actinomadura fibrosa]
MWTSIGFSQNFPGRNYTAANELPNNSVRSLLVDSNNILWIGTENGVVRKENDVFKYFFEEDGLALNSCWAIAEDENKNLWFGSYGEGVSIYDGYRFQVISEEDGLVHNEITKLFSHGNRMYVGTSNGVSIIDINTLRVESMDVPPVDGLFRVQGFFQYGKNIYVVAYNYGKSGVYKIARQNDRTRLVKVSHKKFIYSVFIDNDSIYSSSKGYVTKTKLSEYVSKEDSLSSERFGNTIIWDYVKTRDRKIFAAAWGIYESTGGIFEIANDQLISRASDFNVPSNEVIALAYDQKFEKLYVGTKDAGLFEINLNSRIKFQRIPDTNVIGFAEAERTSAVLLEDAIIIRKGDREKEITQAQLKQWEVNFLRSTKLPLPKHEDSFYELEYATKAKDIRFYDIKVSQNVYWVNSNIGLFAIKESGELERYLPLHSEEINFTATGDLIETHPYGGVRLYNDLENFKYTHFVQEDPQTPTMVVNSVRKDDKTYFLSVFSGLYVWENNRFKSYLETGTWKEKKLRHITTLGNNLAISSEFGDVFILNDEGSFEVLKKIPRANIQGNSISFLKEYKGSLIIGTEKGLTVVKDNRAIFLNEEQGLQQPLLAARVERNILLIGSNNGYYTIDLDEVGAAKPLVDHINLKGIFVNNNKLPLEAVGKKEKIELPYNENTVLLRFSTNAHPFPHKLSYQYRLNGNDEWSPASPKPEIFLPFLPADNYDVDVKVLDKSTGLSHTSSLLKLSILPPFWKTWWFILLAVSLLVMASYSFYRFQITQTRNFEEQKGLIQKRFEETKMEALLAQMNPHFIFNAMNSIQHYIMDSDIDNATSFLDDFARLIRLNLDHCTKPTILLVEEIEYLQSYIRIENTRFNNAINVNFEIDDSIDQYDIEIPTMIIQTFVENVFVHAFPPEISEPTLKVAFKLVAEDVLQCRIEDNGVGYSERPKNNLHKSKGVILVKERLALLGYNVEEAIQIISAKNKGTSVIITLAV